MCRYRHELLMHAKDKVPLDETKLLERQGIKKEDYKRHRFDRNNETTEENNQERECIETTERQHSAMYFRKTRTTIRTTSTKNTPYLYMSHRKVNNNKIRITVRLPSFWLKLAIERASQVKQ